MTPVGYINFGNLLMHMKDFEHAERFFNRAIELDANAATAYYGLGNLYLNNRFINQHKKTSRKQWN